MIINGCELRHWAFFMENGSAGLQCDKIADFSEGTLGLSANLPKNPQSLHSHTANTNFFVCSGSPIESTPRQRQALMGFYKVAVLSTP